PGRMACLRSARFASSALSVSLAAPAQCGRCTRPLAAGVLVVFTPTTPFLLRRARLPVRCRISGLRGHRGGSARLPTTPRARGGAAGAAAPFGQVIDVGVPVVTPFVKLAQWKAAHGVPSGPNAALSNQIRPWLAVIAFA